MLKLTVLVKRHPDLTVDEFHERWRAHGHTIANEPSFRNYIKRYEQHHRVADDYRNGDTFDGMALQWFDDYDGFIGFISTPAYAEKIRPDEDALLDMNGLVVIFTDEAEVFIP